MQTVREMVKYSVFKGTTGTRIAVTDDKSGKKLPKRDFGDWVFARETDFVPGAKTIGPPAEDVIAAVEKDGYYLWPEPTAK
jgi:hypothetical protein